MSTQVRFGTILRDHDFMLSGRLWRRTRGTFALPVDQIGMGHVGWPFDVNTLVTPCYGGNAERNTAGMAMTGKAIKTCIVKFRDEVRQRGIENAEDANEFVYNLLGDSGVDRDSEEFNELMRALFAAADAKFPTDQPR
ncbi:MAG: hypothetical protein VB131_03325 [Burkholderia gladioli]